MANPLDQSQTINGGNVQQPGTAHPGQYPQTATPPPPVPPVTGNSPAPNANTLNPPNVPGTNSPFQSLPGVTPQNAGQTGFTSGMSQADLNTMIGRYYATAGLPVPTDYSMWDNYYNQWGSNDPNYYQTRLLNGLSQMSGANMSAWNGLQSPTAAGGWGPGTAGYQGANGTNGPGSGGGANIPSSPTINAGPDISGQFKGLGTTGTLQDPNQQGLYNQLLALSKQSLDINPATDPIIAPQVNAYNAEQQRSNRSYLQQLAEAQGPNANLTAQGAQMSENAAQQTGALQAQLTQNELTARRQEIEQALQEQGSTLTAQQQMSLQQYLGQIQAALSQQQINSANDQFLAQYGLNADNLAWYQNAVGSGLING